MKRHNALFAGQETGQIGTKRLTIAFEFSVRRVATNVIDQVLRNVPFGAKGETGRVGKMKVGVNEALVTARVLEHVGLKVRVGFTSNIVATNFGRVGAPVVEFFYKNSISVRHA